MSITNKPYPLPARLLFDLHRIKADLGSSSSPSSHPPTPIPPMITPPLEQPVIFGSQVRVSVVAGGAVPIL